MLDTETKRRIDSCRDILVGKIPDPKAQVEQITIALIYKFMDDMDKEAVYMGGKASFFTGEFDRYSWSSIFDPRIGGHELLNLYGEALVKMNNNPNIPQLFRDIFKNAFLPFRDPETLKMFLKEINKFQYDHSEKLGDAFEYLLSVLSSQGDAGQFRTPRHIIDFIVEVVEPRLNETILDPACGTAGFLISAYKHIKKENPKLSAAQKKKLLNNVVGYDISPDMVRLSLVNMYLHGFVEPQIHEYDTLSSETRWQESFDCIMANPPFMTPKGGIRPHNKFSITAKRSEVLFVDYIAEHLNPSGRAGIVVPEGIVNTNQNAYKKLRRLLVRDFLVAVVSLPRGIFNPYSNIKTYVLVLDKSFAKKTQDILFLRIDDDGFDLGVQRKPHAFNDIPFAMREFSNYKRAMINGGSFVPQLDSTIILAREAILSNAAACLFAEAYINNQRFASSPDCKWVKLKDIITEARTRVKDRKDVAVLSMTMKHGLIEQAQKFKNDIASKNLCSYKLVKKGQLVIGFPINEGVLAVSKSHEFGAVSPAYSVWDINYSGLNIDYFDAVIKAPRMIEEYERLMTGTTGRRKTISKESFMDLMIPIPLEKMQNSIVKEITDILALKNNIAQKQTKMLRELNGIWDSHAATQSPKSGARAPRPRPNFSQKNALSQTQP